MARGSHAGSPVLVRYNSTAAAWVGHPDLPVKLGFAIPLNSPNPGGLPDAEENQQLGVIEDLIVAKVSEAARAVLVLVITSGEMKEFIFYVEQKEFIPQLHQDLQNSIESHDVQCMATMEADWVTYRQFAP